jgi:DNA-binding IclR family transcriptional regulator
VRNIVDCVAFERELRVVVPIGIQVPAYLSAIGRSLLQVLPADRLASVLPPKRPRPTIHRKPAIALKAGLLRCRDAIEAKVGMAAR